jgi:hypothetical protein
MAVAPLLVGYFGWIDTAVRLIKASDACIAKEKMTLPSSSFASLMQQENIAFP